VGRSDGVAQPALTVEELIRQVRALAEKTDLITGNTRWYLFGSALRDPVRAADVDLLVVCQSLSDADTIRRSAGKIASCKPVDFSILTEEKRPRPASSSISAASRSFPPVGDAHSTCCPAPSGAIAAMGNSWRIAQVADLSDTTRTRALVIPR
jgi:hypothetical protein